ncbi:histidine kinase [Nevskia sp.]|uniref:sensor histidine kinase n=1 Tax=Nevskia sp. TaxID=1929292 RepID=UPI0025E73DF9|nr:histidine kinase [Nevskia sp.]
MTDPDRPAEASAALPSSSWNSPMAPLSLAAYVTWLAIASGPVIDAIDGRMTLDARTVIGALALVAQPLLFIGRARADLHDQGAHAERWVLWQLPLALLAVWGLPRTGSTAILMILVVAQLFAVFPVRRALLLTLAMNAGLAALLISQFGPRRAVSALLAYGGFQAFAALTTSYARRAEHARDQLRTINAELLATRQLLLESARGEERLRLSRELHDVAGHKLTALKLHLRLIEREIDDGAPRAAIGDCVRLSDELLADVRGVVDALRAHDGIDLHAALRALAPNLPRPIVAFALADDARVSRLDQAQALLRVAQEALTNALRHAACTQIVIRLHAVADGIELQVEDDGRATALPVDGNGLRGMRERLDAVGGRLALALNPGGGLRLTALLPSPLPVHFPARGAVS